MAWIEKGKPSPFAGQPIEGWFQLDGDLLARQYKRDWTRGYTLAMIAFPSGWECQLWEGDSSPIVHLFGEMDLALFSTRDEAWEYANYVAETCGYLAGRKGHDALELWGWEEEEHFLVRYDNVQRLMIDLIRVRIRP